ncbi:MAG: tetratricopeptide repeat-containing glycosyltransferase family protein [Pirellula sp.]
MNREQFESKPLPQNMLSQVDHLFRAGVECLKQGRMQEAVSALQQVLSLDPRHAQAYNNLGVVLAQLTRFSQAAHCFSMALRIQPDSTDSQRNLTQVTADLEKNGPDHLSSRMPFDISLAGAEVEYAAGMSEVARGDFDSAQATLRRALNINPAHAMSHYGLAMLYAELGRLSESIESLRRSLAYDPTSAIARYDLARLRLQLGDFERGWPEFESRWEVKGANVRNFNRPLWNGEFMEHRTILLHGEQGIGDVIQFIRYAEVVKQKSGARILVSSPPSLHPLLSTCPGVDQMVGMGPVLPPFDAHASLMSLPWIVKTRLESIPSQIPYLTANAALVERWKKDFATMAGFKIGIVWQGTPTYTRDHNRSIALKHFEPLARVPGVRLVSLQKGPGVEELRSVADDWPILDMDRRIDENTGSFMDTAAVMMNLDLMISVDTSACHLAGALGVPIWLPVWKVPEWRWLIDRDDSPWYPSMRLFRQKKLGNWDEVMRRMADEVNQLMNSRRAT